MICKFHQAEDGAWLERAHSEEDNNTICAWYRKGSRFQMLFLELIN